MAITKAAVTTTAASVLAASTSRTWLFLYNQSDTTIKIAFTNDAASLTVDSGTYPGIALAAGAIMAFTTDTNRIQHIQNALWAIHEGSGSKALVIHEG